MLRMLKMWCMMVGLLCVMCAGATAEFDLTVFEFDGDFEGMYTVTREEDDVFIDADFSAKEMSFSHKNDSQYYYSTFMADVIVIDYQQSGEFAVPRIWISYCSEEGALNAKKAEFTLRGKTYTFTLDEPEIEKLEKGTTRERILICLGLDAFELMYDWYEAAANDERVRVRLIGENDEISFELSDTVSDSAGLLWELFAQAGGMETIEEVIQTPVSVTQAPLQKRNAGVGVLQYHDTANNAVFEVPAGWALSETEENEEGAIRFEWADKESKESAYIVYVSSDLWTEMLSRNAETMKELTRTSLDDVFTAQDIAEMYNIDVSDVKKVTRGNQVYYRAEVLRIEKPFSYTDVVYFNVVNGYSYLFKYTGSASRLDDLDRMVESAEHFRAM